MDKLSLVIGYIGLAFGIMVTIPQIIKSYREKSTQGVSKLTYIFLLIAVTCYFIRAIAIKEWIFIISNLFQILATIVLLWLLFKNERKTNV